MPFYLYQAKYSSDSWKAMIANPQDRTAAANKVVEACGGKIHHFLLAFGEYDIVVIMEAPDNASAAATAMAVAGVGTVSASKTTVLMTPEEAVGAMRKAGTAAGSYSPPS